MSESKDLGNSGNACVVCYKDVEIYSIGLCEHPVCYECSTRMRVLCQQNECPICRQDLPKVVFTKVIKPFRHLRRSDLLDTRYNIYFDSLEIQERFTMLLINVCPLCKDTQVFSNFKGLKDHMRIQHELHYCDLCVENLRIFSHERRCYTRSNLSQHRRKGDPDDKSHKGHPLCKFCDQRYMDNDELYRHLRRDHLYCHLCDTDGLHYYYNSYTDLGDHFRTEHYLCEEGSCVDQMLTGVFRTDIDLKVHKADKHGKHLSKAAAKQARTLELEFTLAPRGDNRNGRRVAVGPSTSAANSGSGSNSRKVRDYNNREHGAASREYQAESGDYGGFPQIPYDLESAAFIRQPDVRSTEEFPSLGSSSPVIPNLGQNRGRGNLTIRGTMKPQTLAVTDENFPALGPESSMPGCAATAEAASGISKTLNFSVFSTKTETTPNSNQRPQSAAPNVSIHVNHNKADGTVTTRVSGPNIRIRPTQRSSMDCNFPALGKSDPGTGMYTTTTANNAGQWTKVTCVKPTPTPKASKVAPSPFADYPPQADDFPSLAKPAKAKKQVSVASVAVPPEEATWPRDNDPKPTVADATKGKAKKKKVKQPQATGSNSSGNESTSSKTNTTKSEKKSGSNENSQKNGSTTKGKKTADLTDTGKSEEASKREEKSKKDKRKGSASPDDKQTTEKKCVTETSEGTLRKRSELKINPLNSSDSEIRRNSEDFPSLGKSEKSRVTNPPPGFSTATPPPPGFAIKIDANEQRDRLDNGLTFTNSSGEIYSILPTKSEINKIHVYAPPPDFQKRNKILVARVAEVLGDQESIQEFRNLSGLFRQGACSAEDYYKRCRSAMGLSEFENVFPEILVLLPDIGKQQELFAVHQREVNGKIRILDACLSCGQVLKIGADQRAHLSSHTMENHFPALGDTANVQPPSTNWVVRKL